MKIRYIVGEPYRAWVQSRQNPDQEHLVDLVEDACGCPDWTCRQRKYKERTGKPFRCDHLKAFRDDIMDGILARERT